MPETIVAAVPEGLSTLASVVTYIFSIIAEVCSTIVTTPILLLPVGIMVAGAGIGLSKRFIGR